MGFFQSFFGHFCVHSILNRHVYCIILSLMIFFLYYLKFQWLCMYMYISLQCCVCVGYIVQEVPVAWPLLTSMHGLFGCMVAPLSGVMTWWPCMSVDLFIHVSMLSVGLSVRTSAPIQQATRKLQTGCRHCVCCHRYLIFPTIVVKTQAWLS